MIHVKTTSDRRLRLRYRMNGVGNAFLNEPGYCYPPGVEYRFVAQTSGSLLVEDAEEPHNLVFHLLFDCGLGVVNSLLNAGITSLSHVFISHRHPDHIVELDRLYQGYRRSARRRGLEFRVPCYCTPETRRTGPDHLYPYLGWDRIDVVPGQPVLPLGGGVYANQGLDFGLRVTPVSVYHGNPAIVPDPVIWVIDFESEEGLKKIVLGWDFLHLVPRYVGEDREAPQTDKYKSPLPDRTLESDGLDSTHEVLCGADLLILEANTLHPLPATGHTSIEAAIRFTIRALAPKGETWLVHYSGLEPPSELPLPDDVLRNWIEVFRTQYQLDQKYVIHLARPAYVWPAEPGAAADRRGVTAFPG
jgi:Beta-lactamase superfamily domain